ncbi:centrosomal protein of 104 kDa isoform X7 [Bubalus kerabau]|uniref:centrosomal protein of 104 kDa isoform X7 n=1 Tax=Bubalus carabanensis TaxID=3119969 RepID=UPI00244EC924|nr:centrosomal protein of 104 kDa isoform X7 [Bubalus carabanensis]
MPHKIGFVVVSSSGHEDGFSARELMIHAPTVSGWRSPRFCQFPQEIVLQMVERCQIRKLQLLAHQYMIPSKVEFYISESLPEYFTPYQAERFRRLGYVSLCDNEKTGCKARELKSVYVDAVGQFLKLIFHQNHVNKYNVYNQVALVAVNIIGDPADFGDESNITSREKLIDHYLGHNAEDPALEGTCSGKSDYISPLDDLAFDMYQDPEVAQIIRRLDERKREAVQKERYDYAKKLKQAIADLQKEKPSSHCLDVSPQRPTVDRPPPATDPPPKTHPDSLPYDERPLPVTRKQLGAAVSEAERRDVLSDEARRADTAGEPEPLTEKALREASSAVDVLGEALVAGAYSKTWSHREDALLTLHKQLTDTPVGTPKEDLKSTLRAAVFLVRRAIRDIVTPVFQASLKLLKMIITQYIPKHKLGRLETAHCVERTIPVLLTRTGDSSARLRLMASNFIQEIALFKEVKSLQVIPSYLVQPLKASSSTHLAMSQMALLARLLRDLGTEGAGFTVDSVMRFSVQALEHRVREVREAAVGMILDLYAQHRALVLEYLPPDDNTTRRNVLYKTIFEGFAKIDGRPTDAEMRAQKRATAEEAEKRKKEEIRALQGQLAALKEMQAEVQEKKSEAMKAKNQDTQERKVAPPNAPEIPDNHYLDNLCIFCGERSESFTEEGLDLHYWKHCLMLTRCEHCRQVVEISSLTEHLLTECDQKDGFGRCYRCSEAVSKEELPRHVKTRDCNPAKSEKLASRCPLCHENFSPGEEAWKAHLMGPAGCTMNLRRTHVLHRTPVLPPGVSSWVALPPAGWVTAMHGADPLVKAQPPPGQGPQDPRWEARSPPRRGA